MTDLLATVRPDLTYAEARELTDSICAQVSELLPKLGEAFERRAWVALGYESWDSYCADEFRGLRWPVEDRQAAVVELAGKGMSRRAIGSALGVDEKTVRNDLRGAEFSAPPTVVGADGKEQPATKPTNERLTPPPATTPTTSARSTRTGLALSSWPPSADSSTSTDFEPSSPRS